MSPRVSSNIGGILSRKPTVQILILGGYNPRQAKARLTKLRDYLRQHGYRQSYLLGNLPFRRRQRSEGVNVYFARKSKEYLRHWADIALFVFMCDVNNMGVLSEFDFTQYSLHDSVFRTSTVLIDENCDFPSLTTMGTIVLSGVDQRFFKNDEKLCQAAKAECLDHLKKLY